MGIRFQKAWEGKQVSHRAEASEAYFRTRARGSQIGAWASRQSEDLADRSELEGRAEEIDQRFTDQDVPFPTFWGGYRIVPERIEFWQGRLNRLHDRLLFSRAEEGWAARRLYP